MKIIKLTQNKHTLVDDEDFDDLNQFKWYVVNKGNTSYAYRKVWVKKEKRQKTIYIHRLIMNPPSHLNIDHKDGNGLNNQKENLRQCTQSQNNGNIKKLHKHNTSCIRGVYFRKGRNKWCSGIYIKNKRKSLGHYKCPLMAKLAYDKEARKHFGEFYA